MHLKTRRNAYGILIVTAVAALAVMTLSCLVEPLDDFRRDNEVDPGAGNYQGFDTVDDPNGVKAHSTGRVWPAFTVSELLGADTYHLQIATSESVAAGTVLHDGQNYDSNVMRPSGGDMNLVGETTYYWRGRAKLPGADPGNWTPVRSFTLDDVFGSRSPVDQATTADVRPTVSWDAVGGAVGYEVQFGDSEAGVLDGQGVATAETTLEFPFDLQEGDTGYWRVRARDGSDVYCAWSAVFSIQSAISFFDDFSVDTSSAYAFEAWPKEKQFDEYEISVDTEAGYLRAFLIRAENDTHSIVYHRDYFEIPPNTDFDLETETYAWGTWKDSVIGGFDLRTRLAGEQYLSFLRSQWGSSNTVYLRTHEQSYVSIDRGSLFQPGWKSLRIQRLGNQYTAWFKEEVIWSGQLPELEGESLIFGLRNSRTTSAGSAERLYRSLRIKIGM